MKKIEILAPAGSKESFIAAVSANADAIYCGLNNFNARSKAQNFNPRQISSFIDYAHQNNTKVYIAFNTLIKENEIKEAAELIDIISSAKADAIIVQDFAVISLITKYFPNLKLHLSTQGAIHNSFGALAAKKSGFKRAVLARELSLAQIKSISRACDIELEIFVHGSLCFCVSGLCMLSSFIGGRSANRGSCSQVCRRKWSFDDKEGFYLSPKDLDLSQYIKDLKKSGISSLKIEGRMKNPQYVYKTVRAYKMLAEADENSSNWADIVQEANTLLSSDFARVKTSFNFAYKSNHIFEPEMPKQIGAFLGEVLESEDNKFKIKTNALLNINDVFKAGSPKDENYFRFKAQEIKKDGEFYEITTTEIASQARNDKGQTYNDDIAPIRKGYFIFKTADGKFNDFLSVIAGIDPQSPSKQKQTGIGIYCASNPAMTTKGDDNIITFPKFNKNKTPAQLFLKIDDIGWLKLIKNKEASIILALNKDNLNKAQGFDYFEIPPFIDEEDLVLYQKTISGICKSQNKSFFLNNLGHFEFFKGLKAQLNAGMFLYVLNSFSADFLFKRGVKNFVFSIEDDYKNISKLCAAGLAGGGIFYMSGLAALAISKMKAHQDLQNKEIIIKSGQDQFKIIAKENIDYIVPAIPIMLFNKKFRLEKLQINKFLIDLSFIKPNEAYLNAVLNAHSGKQFLQNNNEFNFDRNLK
ncbi:MAG: U32 family peptidase [Elusimicrobiota bacterium]|nr:U32 family peptidase [Elusimicrobiota bacterium]